MPRPAGLAKTGGRKPGTPNRASAAREAEINAAGLTPLDFMLSVMRDTEASTDTRLDAAARAAPYVHPRLASVSVANKDGQSFAISVEAVEREREGRAAAAWALLDAAFGAPDETADQPPFWCPRIAE
jgi:hypothetical protein